MKQTNASLLQQRTDTVRIKRTESDIELSP